MLPAVASNLLPPNWELPDLPTLEELHQLLGAAQAYQPLGLAKWCQASSAAMLGEPHIGIGPVLASRRLRPRASFVPGIEHRAVGQQQLRGGDLLVARRFVQRRVTSSGACFGYCELQPFSEKPPVFWTQTINRKILKKQMLDIILEVTDSQKVTKNNLFNQKFHQCFSTQHRQTLKYFKTKHIHNHSQTEQT